MNDQKNVPVRCKPDDPRRCQGSTQNGQCPFLSLPDQEFCVIHGRRSQDTGLYQFKRTEVLIKLAQFKNHSDSRTLTVELGLLRLMLEELMNKCESNYDFLTQSAQIINLLDKIKDLQVANTKLEQRVGDLLSIEQVIEIAQQLYGIVVAYLTATDDQGNPLVPESEEILGKIAENFETVLTC